jgi:hypothetical protein
MSQTPVFLISSGRCGSTFFSDAIHSHPDMLSVSELIEPVIPVPFLDKTPHLTGKEFFALLSAPTMDERIDIWRSSMTPECLYMPQQRNKVSLLLCYAIPLLSDEPECYLRQLEKHVAEFPLATGPEHFLRFCELLKDLHGKKVWVERSGGSLPHCKDILECWPKAKIIHFYRDGRDVACSMRSHPIFRMFVMKRLGLDWRNETTPDIVEFGKLWSEWVCQAVPHLNANNHRVLNMSYEAMMESPDESLTRFLTFVFGKDSLNIHDRNWIQKVIAQIRPASKHQQVLSDSEISRLTKACEPGLQALGYLS